MYYDEKVGSDGWAGKGLTLWPQKLTLQITAHAQADTVKPTAVQIIVSSAVMCQYTGPLKLRLQRTHRQIQPSPLRCRLKLAAAL